ncbi:MAG TPA: gephyrin-like molybdotransferase Glp [Allosphingosinicella sp.]|jgi:molybdopterin molybdotransferase
MLTLDEARNRLLQGVAPLGAERVPLGECGGRTLAEDVVAVRSQPPEAVSAMDGYAVSGGDAHAGAVLRLIGEAPAGAPFAGAVTPGTAVRVATGGIVPLGADRVVMQEIAVRDGDRVSIVEAPGEARYVRAAGSDFTAGQAILRAGERLTPARLGLAAAANRAELLVHPAPRIAILPSGDELREPGAVLGMGDIVNSAAYAVAELVSAWGGVPLRLPILPDDRDACRARLADAMPEAEVILPLGGASVGERDALRPLFEGLGAEMLFDRVAVQPGKPTWHARLPDGRHVLGLPGNPASAFVCAWLFLKPLIDRLSGRGDEGLRLIRARSEADLPANGAREQFLRGRVRIGEDAQLLALAEPKQDSYLQLSLARANALIRRPANAPPLAAGGAVEVLAIGELG